MSSERIAIIGCGTAGLATALALDGTGREVVIVERDPAPPEIEPEAAFEAWARPGVPQFRHAHIMLGRLQSLLREHHPKLLEELLDAGLELSRLSESFHEDLVGELQPSDGDDDLLHLWGRRATFEYVVRRHVGRLAHVRFIHDATVQGVLFDDAGAELRATGLRYVDGDSVRHELAADVVVDASGRRSEATQWLSAAGAQVEVQCHPSRFIYACRHYRLRDPSDRPSRRDGGGNLDYLGYASFHAEHGHFALTFGCPVDERELAAAMRRPEGFETLCAQFPALMRWRERSEPRSKVIGAGKFENRWTDFANSRGRAVHGFFAVGDSHIETNPMYGRGCACAFVQARTLADTLVAQADPATRSARYYARVREQLKPYYDVSIGTDRIYHTRARLRRGLPVPLGQRLVNHFYERAFLPATQRDLLVAREFVKAQQMREQSALRLRLAMALRILATWVLGLFGRAAGPLKAHVPPRKRFIAQVAGDEAGEERSPQLSR